MFAMNGSRSTSLPALAALTVSVGWVFAWLGGWVIDSGTWPARAGLLAVGLSLATAVTYLLSWRLNNSNRVAQDYFQNLCRQHNLKAGELGAGGVAPLPTNDT
jgi:hypothetical protein